MKLYFLLLFKWKFTKASPRLASSWDSCALKPLCQYGGLVHGGTTRGGSLSQLTSFFANKLLLIWSQIQSSKQTPKLLQTFQNFTLLSHLKDSQLFKCHISKTLFLQHIKQKEKPLNFKVKIILIKKYLFCIGEFPSAIVYYL